MKKFKRHLQILDIIKNSDIETQEELAVRLNEAGFLVTQATISRDIRDLNLVKVATSKDKQKYVVSNTSSVDFMDRLYRIFSDAVLTIENANNMVVIKTLDGMAMGVAASLDAMDKSTIVGTIAGDDTLFCVLKTNADAEKLVNELNQIL